MPQHFSLLRRAALAVTAALSLAACNRAEYATLPKSPAYLGSAPAHYAPRPAAPVATAPAAAPSIEAPATAAPVTAPAPLAPRVAVAKPAPKAVAAAPVNQPQPVAVAPVTAEAAPQAPEVVAAPVAPAKPNLIQRLALKKVSKKLDKLMANMPQLKQGDNAASTSRLDSNLRTGLVLIVAGLLIAIFSFISGIFGVIGAIVAVIGLLFIILWAIDQA